MFQQTTFENATEAFEAIHSLIMSSGIETNVGTKAVYNVGILIKNPTQRDITTKWRKWSKKYAEREWNWYLSGNPSVEELKKFAPKWDEMHGSDNIVNSNYGFQWMRNGQLDKCIEQLKKNPNSRQAWVSIYDGKEKDKSAFDTPCTLAVGFDINPATPDCLNMTVMMRSNDIIYGFCNDQYCFSKLQEMVAEKLGLKVGTYYHFAHDMHIYNYHYDLKDKFYGTN